MNYEAQRRRQWEVNVFHNLGFLFDGFSIEETNHGWKNETREATSIEEDFWRRCEGTTPEIPTVQVSDEIDLYDSSSSIPFENFEDKALDNKIMWLENKYELALCSRDYYNTWSVVYREYKEIRSR